MIVLQTVNSKRLLQHFLDMTVIDSLSLNEEDMGNHVIGVLRELGMTVEVDGAGPANGGNMGNVYGLLPGDPQRGPLLFIAHLDTVKPGNGIRPVVKAEEGMVYSSGDTILAADDKAGIAAILEAVRTVVDMGEPHGDIEVLFTIAEEIGLRGSKFFDVSRLRSNKGYLLDSSGRAGEAVYKAPAQSSLYVDIRGKSAHAGVSPEKGISAIQVAAEAIYHMNLLRIDQETTANIGVIRGGEATNIVCGHVYLEGEVRSLNDYKLKQQIEHMTTCLQGAADHFGAACKIRTEHMYHEFIIPEDSEVICLFDKATQTLGRKMTLKPSGGGSDANIFNQKGITTLNIACGMANTHTLSESLMIDEMTATAQLLHELILLA